MAGQLTPDKIHKIIELRKKGRTQVAIGEALGVSQDEISSLLTAWRM